MFTCFCCLLLCTSTSLSTMKFREFLVHLKAVAKEHGVSNAELEVLALAMEGRSTAAIAKSIGISGDAVRKRFSEVYQKFQIGGRGPVKLTKLQQLLMFRYQAQLKTQIESILRSGELAGIYLQPRFVSHRIL